MKIYISTDMEGITGITSGEEVIRKEGEGNDYSRFRKLMTRDVNGAIEGALAGGATKILVNDGHGGMRNILVEELNGEAELISGSLKPFSQMEGLDSSFDGVFCIGYHTMSGTAGGILSHTYYGRKINDILINGRRVGELGMNAAYAGALGVPVIFVSGDDKLAAEAKDLIGEVETAVIKWGISINSAQLLSPQKSKELIREGAQSALENLKQGKYKPFSVKTPVTIEICFKSTEDVAKLEFLPQLKRTDGRTITMEFDDYREGYKNLIGILGLI